MRTFVLMPHRLDLAYAVVDGETTISEGAAPTDESVEAAVSAVLGRAAAVFCRRDGKGLPPWDRIAVRVPFGGDRFAGPTRASDEALAALDELAVAAPAHLPVTTEVVRSVRAWAPDVPCVLVFESAFFVGLPPFESDYAIPSDLLDPRLARRTGLHGLFHSAACAYAWSRLGRPTERLPRILSLCLEPKPEVAAVLGARPCITTGGASPLDGLPGPTQCGEIDPGLVLTLAEQHGWSPERIDRALGGESGWLGLTGKPAGLDAVARGEGQEGALAREVLEYRLLLACGAGVAALGGLDAAVFSGRYADLGTTLGAGVLDRLDRALDRDAVDDGDETRGERPRLVFREPLVKLVARESWRA